MLIEATSTRLALDLFETLRKQKLTVSEIRVSFSSKSGSAYFRTFASYEVFKTFYLDNYNKFVSSRRNPFTSEKRLARFTPVIENGLIVGNATEPINSSNIKGFCELGLLLCVERFKVTSSSFNYDVNFNCIDVCDNYKIIEGRGIDLRRNINRKAGLDRHKNSLIKFINQYKQILTKVSRAFNANLYVDLCYVEIGYVEESLLLYSTFFSIVKKRIDSGLSLEVLQPQYLKKI